MTLGHVDIAFIIVFLNRSLKLIAASAGLLEEF
jgi:hypothetical protein